MSADDADVLRILSRDHPAPEREAILRLLTQYGNAPSHAEHARVRLAILKLADGDAAAIATYVQMACLDYRDVVASAESPHTMALGFPAGSDAAAQRRRAFDADRRAYESWFTRS